jgi:hypothetical protein
MGTIVPPVPASVDGPRRSFRDHWRSEVLRTGRVGDATKVLLLTMHDDMDPQGYVSVPRPVLAERLGRSERRVTERLTEAVGARLLDHVRRGQKGVTPVYRAMLPQSFSGTDCSPLSRIQRDGSEPAERAEVSPDRPAETPFSGTPGGPTSSKAHPRSKPHAQIEPGQFTSLDDQRTEDVDPTPRRTAARPLTLVPPVLCRHDDPHPELCQLCRRERKSA